MDKAYSVLKIDYLVRPGDVEGLNKLYRIMYKTKGGIRDTVEVAEKDYTEEKVNTLLTKLAEKHDKILVL